MPEKDPAKQTPDGQKTRPGTTPSSKQKTADSSTGKKASSKSSKTAVQVSLDPVQTDILDNLRDATSRHDYLQRLVDAYLNNANPNSVFVEDDDLPGNERAVKNPDLRGL